MGHSTITRPRTDAAPSPALTHALMQLEDICLEIKDGQFTHGKEDIDRLYWQQKLKNIAAPISMALAEYRGPRVFHHHYTHDGDEEFASIPVLESARDNLLKVCLRTLAECEEMVGMKGAKLIEEKSRLKKALKQLVETA